MKTLLWKGLALSSFAMSLAACQTTAPSCAGWEKITVKQATAVYLAGGSAIPVDGRGGKASKFLNMKVKRGRGVGTVEFDPKTEEGSPEAIVDSWLERLVQRPVEEHQKKVLVDVVKADPRSEENVRKMVQLIVSMPEYQLC